MNLFDEITGKNKNQNQNQVQTKKRDDEEFQSSMSLFDEITGSKNQQTQSTTESPSFNSIFEEITSQKVSTDVSFDTTQKDVGSTVGYTAGKVGTGGLSVVEGVADTGAWLLKQAGKLTSWLMDNPVGRFLFGEYAGDYEANPLYQIGDSMIQGEVAGTFDQILDESEMAQRSYVEPGSLGANVASGVGQVGGMILTGKMIPGGKIGTLPQNATKAQKVLNTANNIVNKINPTTKTMFASTFGNSYSQASNSGADEFEATTFGLLNATKETATEMMYGGLGKAFGKGALDDVVKEQVTGLITNKLGKKIAEIGIGMTAEGLEEVAASLLQPFVDSVYTKKLDFSSYNSILDDFITGALVSGVLQTGSNVVNLKGKNPQEVATKLQQQSLQEKLDTISTQTNQIVDNENVNNKTKIDRINNQLDILNDQLTQDAPIGTIDIQGIYNQKVELMKKRDDLLVKASEQQKIEIVNELSNQVTEVLNAPEGTVDNAIIEAANDKVEQIEKITEEVEKDKKIKVLSNKQNIKLNGQQYVNEAAAIVEQMNMNIPEGQERVTIVTELNDEQRQIMDLGSVFGKQVIFTQNMPQSGVVSNQNPNILFIDNNINSKLITNNEGAMLYTMGHELFHSLKMSEPKTYNEFINYTKDSLTFEQIINFVERYDTTQANQILDSLKINGKFDLEQIIQNSSKYKTQNQSLTNITEEIVANEFGGMITDKNYMNKLYEDNPSLFKKVINAIRELFKSLDGSIYDSSLTQLQVEKIRNDFENIIKETQQKETKTKETVQPAVQKETVQQTKPIETKETVTKPIKLQNILEAKEKTVIKDVDGNVVDFYRLHKDAANMVEDYDYNQSSTSHVAGFGLELRNDEMYTKGKDAKDVVKTKLYTNKGMLQNDGQKIGLKRVERINKIANRYMETKGENYFGVEPIRSDKLIDAINQMANVIANNTDNATGRKAWVEFYDNIGKDGYIKTEPDNSLLAVVVNPKQLEFFNETQKQKKKETIQAKKPVTSEIVDTNPVKVSQMSLEDRYKGISRNYERYTKEQNIGDKKTILNATLSMYQNYKIAGGTEVNTELDKLLEQQNKTDFKEALKRQGINIKALPKSEYAGQERESQFYTNTVTKSPIFKSIFDEISKNKDFRYYTTVSHKSDFDKAIKRIQENGDTALNEFLGKDSGFDTVDSAMAKIMIEYYQRTGDVQSEVVVATKIRKAITQGAQLTESAKIFKDLSPASIVVQIQNDITRALEELQRSVDPAVRAWLNDNLSRANLTAAEREWVYQMAEKARKQKYDSPEYRRTYALIQAFVADRIPKSIASKVKAYRRMAMLFNPKTMVRNYGGNLMMQPVNRFSDAFGSKLDAFLAKETGIRTQGSVDKQAFKDGKRQGIAEAKEDMRLGINTSRTNPYEMQQGKTFKDKGAGKVLNWVERWMNYGLNRGDRGWEEAYYQNSLANQMRLNGVTEATETMKQIAQQEAEKKTWKNDGKMMRIATSARNLLNSAFRFTPQGVVVGKQVTESQYFGLGDLVLPFIMTPANLAVAIYDYSPAAALSVANNARKYKQSIKSGKDVAIAQKALVDSFGKASAGVLLYAIGYVLANAGFITGGEDEDKDVRATMRAQGYQPYSIKIGDLTFSYDWAQPLANPFATMAELHRQTEMNKNNPNKSDDANNAFKAISEAFTIGGDRLYEQSFLQSLKNLLSAESPKDGIIQFSTDLPQSFVPTLFKQVADMIDGTAKSTYDGNNLLTTMFAKAAVKVPFLKSTLPTKKDILGNDVQMYGGENNIFNVMFNPANVSRDIMGDIGNEIIDVYNHTGENAVMPQVAVRYIDYDSNGDGIKERITFDNAQQAILQQYMGNTMASAMSEMLNNDVYQNASYEDKATALISLMQYSKALALRETALVPNYEIKTGNAAQINNYVNQGLNIPNAVMYDSLINPIKGYKDANGDSVKGSENGQKAYAIMNMQISDDAKNVMLKLISPLSNTPETVDSLANLGTTQQFIDYYSLPRRDVFLMDKFSRDDYDISTTYFNIAGSTYTEFAGNVSQIKADYDKKGNAIPNSKKNKVFAYINSLPLNQYQKLYLFSISGYSINQWKNQMFNYINNMNITANEKKTIWSSLGFE